MVGATDNEGMWEGVRVTQNRKDRQIKRLNFSAMKDIDVLNVGSVTNQSHVDAKNRGDRKQIRIETNFCSKTGR